MPAGTIIEKYVYKTKFLSTHTAWKAYFLPYRRRMCLKAHLKRKIIYRVIIYKQNDCRQNHANLEFWEMCLQALQKTYQSVKQKQYLKKESKLTYSLLALSCVNFPIKALIMTKSAVIREKCACRREMCLHMPCSVPQIYAPVLNVPLFFTKLDQICLE